jgi:hypothetical protein
MRSRREPPGLIIAHSGDPIHALADAKAAARDLPNSELVRARTFFEMRFSPGRLADEVADFLERWWGSQPTARPVSRIS